MFEGQLVRLRGLQESDVARVERMEADAQTLRLRRTGFVYPGGKAEADAFYENNRSDPPSRVGFAIESVENGRFVGRCTVRSVMRNHRSAEIGIALLPSEIGKGYGREALGLVVDYALGAMSLNRVWGSVRADNERSLRLFRAAGFTEEARFREAALGWDGERVDVLSVSMLRREWQEART